MIEKIFKIGLLIISTLFLFLCYQHTGTNRFIRDNSGYIFDTKTGKIYTFEKEVTKKWIVIDPVGEAITLDTLDLNAKGGNP